MSDLEQEIAAYETLRVDLEAKHTGKWIVVHDRVQVGLYDSFELAATEAVKQFGIGPYLIRQIGAPALTLPASVIYNLTHG